METALDRPAFRAARRRDFLVAAILVIATFIVYHPALHGERLLDDDVHITRPELRSFAGLARIWTEIGATQQYYPVLHTAFWLEHRVWGDAVLGYHLINVLLHSTAALLVVALMRQLRLAGGWLAAFVFALHPVCVESVAWISEQKNTLSTLFYLGAAVSFLRYVERRTAGRYLLATVLFLGALLSKTAAATLPAVLLVILWWRQTLPVDPAFRTAVLQRAALALLPWFAAALAAGMVTLSVERELIAGINAQLSLSWLERTLVAARALWFYLGKLIWPANQSFLYERWEVDASDAAQWIYAVLAIAVMAVCAWLARRNRAPLAALLLFGGTLFPVLGFVNVEWFVFSFVADHFSYVASLAVIVPLAVAATTYNSKQSLGHMRLGIGVAVATIALLGTISWRHSATFRDSVTLYANAAVRAPTSVPAHYLLGVALAERPGHEAQAVAAFEAALRLNPDGAQIHEKLGGVLLRMEGRTRDAIAHLETALQLQPNDRDTRLTLAAACFDEGKILAATPGSELEAIAAYERALQANPEFTEAHFNFGNLLLRMDGRRADAIAHFETAVRLKPDFAEAHTNLGTALATQPGRLAEAIAHFEAALRANPEFAPARNNLARALQVREGIAP